MRTIRTIDSNWTNHAQSIPSIKRDPARFGSTLRTRFAIATATTTAPQQHNNTINFVQKKTKITIRKKVASDPETKSDKNNLN